MNQRIATKTIIFGFKRVKSHPTKGMVSFYRSGRKQQYTKWKMGEITKLNNTRSLKTCNNGLHFSWTAADALKYFLRMEGGYLLLVEIINPNNVSTSSFSKDKVVTTELRPLARIPISARTKTGSVRLEKQLIKLAGFKENN